MIKPKLNWEELDLEEKPLRLKEKPGEVAWWAVLDKRFLIEVQRTEPYKGNLVAFDSKNNNEVVYQKEVNISYDAVFGPDINDVCYWKDIVGDFVDEEYLKNESEIEEK